MLGLQIGDLLGQPGLAGQSLAGEVLTADLHGLLGLTGQLVLLLFELVDLQLEALAAGGDIGNTAADLLQQLQLLLVRIVKGFVGVFGLVQSFVGLGTEDRRDPLEDTHP